MSSATASNPSRSRARWWLLPGLVGAVAAILSMLTLGKSTGPHASMEGQPLYELVKQPLTISVDVSGEVRTDQAVSIKNEVEGQTTIVSLVPEGTYVKAGDLLVELDSSGMVDRKVDQEIVVQTSEASYISARESLVVTKQRADNDVATALLDSEFAKQDVNKYVEGEYPQQLRDANAKIKLAEGQFQRDQDVWEWSEKLYREGYVTKTELKRDELATEKSQIELDKAKGDKELLEKYTNRRQLAELQSEVKQKNIAMLMAKHKASSDVTDAEAALRAREANYKREKQKLAKLIEQIEKTKLYAPVDGMVVHVDVERSGPDEPLAVGLSVRERQELIRLPTTSRLVAHVKVHESQVKKVRVGLPVRITTDALPGRSFGGTSGARDCGVARFAESMDESGSQGVQHRDRGGSEYLHRFASRHELPVRDHGGSFFRCTGSAHPGSGTCAGRHGRVCAGP